MTSKLHIITGISGTGIRNGLQKFKQQMRDRKFPFEWVSVDEELNRIALPLARGLYDIDTPLSIYCLPQDFLRICWLKAFEKQWRKAFALLNRGNNVALTLHLCYFNQLIGGNFLLADIPKIARRFRKLGGRAGGIITLIDDIYDVHCRLSAPGGRFTPPENNSQTVAQLLEILDWRSKEILLSRSLACSTDVKQFLFSVKHKLSSFFDLLYSGKKRAYISHPISEVRKMYVDEEPELASQFIHEISDTISRIQSDYIVFEPATIDELRIDSSTGKLKKRWPFSPLTSNELLFELPNPVSCDCLFPAGWNEDRRDTSNSSLELMNLLVSAIDRQISSRDHDLVEQSEIIIAYRPLFAGNESRGVHEELLHVRRLNNLSSAEKKVRVIAYSEKSDRIDRPYRQFADKILQAWWDDNQITGNAQNFENCRSDVRRKVGVNIQDLFAGNSQALEAFLHKYGLVAKPLAGNKFVDGVMGPETEILRANHIKVLAKQLIDDKEPYLDGFLMDKTADEYFVKSQFFDRINSFR